MRWFLCLLLACLPLSGQTLDQRIRGILDSSPAAPRAHWGIEVRDLEKGQLLFQFNANRFFVPASNTKLFTTALALMRLGPEHRFETRVLADHAPDSSGILAGDLILLGGGDPLLSARAVPYKKGQGAATGNPLQAIEDMADEIARRGVRRIQGDVVGDDTAYVWAPYPDGWAENDALWEYGAPVSALTLNDNAFTLTLRPIRAGLPPAIHLSPALEYYAIDNRVRVRAGEERKVEVERLSGSRQLHLWGSMPADGAAEMQFLLAIDDPALYAATALVDALRRRGVGVDGHAAARHRFANQTPDLKKASAPWRPDAGKTELARRVSPPLVEILRIVDKVSQNLHAELALREVARVRRNLGSREAGLEEMREFLSEAGVETTDYHLSDGSGLSRLNLITADTTTKLLAFLWRSPRRESWVSLLPVGGEDGTLATRFPGQPAARRIHAKTGTLSHVSALSGYAESPTHGTVAFSILVNNYNAPSSEIRAIIDRIALAIAE